MKNLEIFEELCEIFERARFRVHNCQRLLSFHRHEFVRAVDEKLGQDQCCTDTLQTEQQRYRQGTKDQVSRSNRID